MHGEQIRQRFEGLYGTLPQRPRIRYSHARALLLDLRRHESHLYRVLDRSLLERDLAFPTK